MIGPHQGKELELMLAGKKHLAVFSDTPSDDQTISEDIIPEKLFAPHLKTGKILRFSQDIYGPKSNTIIRYVCFTTPEESWRAHAFFWITKDALEKYNQDTASTILIGRLLGYSESDIQDYLDNQKLFTVTIRT